MTDGVNWGAVGAVIQRIFWLLALVAAMTGGFVGLVTVASGSDDHQQAAGAALGCLLVIAPYVVARAIESILK